MKNVVTYLAPPLAVYRYAYARCCAAPIGVFWLAGITALLYGLNDGLLGSSGLEWMMLGLGLVLWAIAVVWTFDTLRRAAEDERDPDCTSGESAHCHVVRPQDDEQDPLEEVRRLSH
ncbi:hypothetical protein HUS23_02290 [Ectothiorhodospiraceae bacterium 2226]|nr:hypothetical protein HUS23_02290 [Ectothiorhodospiraceae bacterium 2226]